MLGKGCFICVTWFSWAVRLLEHGKALMTTGFGQLERSRKALGKGQLGSRRPAKMHALLSQVLCKASLFGEISQSQSDTESWSLSPRTGLRASWVWQLELGYAFTSLILVCPGRTVPDLHSKPSYLASWTSLPTCCLTHCPTSTLTGFKNHSPLLIVPLCPVQSLKLTWCWDVILVYSSHIWEHHNSSFHVPPNWGGIVGILALALHDQF